MVPVASYAHGSRIPRRTLRGRCSVFAFALFLVAALVVWAVPAVSAPLRFVDQAIPQPDGSVAQVFASGDEYFNFLHDAEGYVLMRAADGWLVYAEKVDGDLAPSLLRYGVADPALHGLDPWLTPDPEILQPLVDRARQSQAVPDALKRRAARSSNAGTINNLVIFIRFSDAAGFSTNFSTITTEFDGMDSYFQEVSYSQLETPSTYFPAPSGETILSYQDAQPRGYYQPYDSINNVIGYAGETERRDREFALLQNAVNAVAGDIPAELDIDHDDDGYVDSVSFVIQGSPTGWATLLWPHRWALYLSTYATYIHGKRVWDFSFLLESYLYDSVLSHEMFHVLGAPDLYHYYTATHIDPAGPWDIMENSSFHAHMSCYMKWKYGGWIDTIPELTVAGTYELNPLTSSSGQCYKAPSPASDTEYFVLEYREKSGSYEGNLPSSGLLVWRIDTAVGNGNAYGPPDEVYVLRPNGKPYIDQDTLGSNGNIYSATFSQESGRTELNAQTATTPYLQDGAPGKLVLSNIGSADDTITFDLSWELPPPPPAGMNLAPLNLLLQ